MSVDFSSFDEDDVEGGSPMPLKPKYGNEQTKALKDGEYDCKLTGAELKAMGKDGTGTKFVFYGVVMSGEFAGWKCEREIILEKKDGTDEEKKAFARNKMNEVMADLATIGFDVQNWTKANGRPRSEMLAIACDVLKDLCVKMRKKANGQYANVYINKRLANLDGREAVIGPEQMVSSGLNSPPAEENGKDPVPF